MLSDIEKLLGLSNLVPDGELHRYGKDGMSWYVLTRHFSSKTGAEFFYIAYGNWIDGKGTLDLCTLDPLGAEEKTIVKRARSRASKLEVKACGEMIKDSSKKVVSISGDDVLADMSREEQEKNASENFIYALGFKEKEYFFTTSSNQQIVSISRFGEADMLGLMPLSYWETNYPGSGAQKVDWPGAKSSLMEQARNRGIFQPRRVRGSGVWNDAGRIVVNMGDHLIVDGVPTALGGLESRYFYTLGNALSRLHDDPLDVDDCETLVDACESFKWLKPDYGFLMAGALVVSRICGALPVRPHVWITGGASTGKTTLLEKLILPVLGDAGLYVQGATTEAGVRQSLKADAIPVVFDEFETTGIKSAENVASVIELLRAAWSDSSAMIVKGSSGGNANAYQVRCSAIVSSIRPKLQNDADRSRFAIIELEPHGSDQEHWKRLSQLLDQIDSEYSERLFARTIRMVPILLSNFKRLKVALSSRVSQRFGDQYGMLLAGYSILIQDDALNDQEANFLASHVQLVDEKDEAKVADHDDALTKIQTKRVRFEIDEHGYERTVAEWIHMARTDMHANDALQRIGIKVAQSSVSIAHRHTELENQVFKGTRWSESWGNSLSRLDGTQKNVSTWMAGKNQKCLLVPSRHFWQSV